MILALINALEYIKWASSIWFMKVVVGFRVSFFINIFKKSGSEKIPVDQDQRSMKALFWVEKDIL
jgi:hypothetical protein